LAVNIVYCIAKKDGGRVTKIRTQNSVSLFLNLLSLEHSQLL